MIIELAVVSLLFIGVVTSIIIKRNKPSIVKLIFGLLIMLAYLGFKYYQPLVNYMTYYLLVAMAYSAFVYSTMLPKKITKNISEYDYFELEKDYFDLKNEKEELRQRYLSTVSLIDEGVIFYENGLKDVYLSDKAFEIFKGSKGCSIEEHIQRIYEPDRPDYKAIVEKIGKRIHVYDMKYRIMREDKIIWVYERGHYIDVEGKKSCIATIKPLDFKIYNETAFFEIDSMYKEEKMYPILKNLLMSHTPFSLVLFEFDKIPEMNKKYGREAGNLMMSDYLKFIRNNFAQDVNKIFRVAGIRFAMIIEEKNIYQEFHRALIQNKSSLYSTKLDVAGIKDTLDAKFGVVNYNGNNVIDSAEIYRLAEKSLEEAIQSTRRNYSIFGE